MERSSPSCGGLVACSAPICAISRQMRLCGRGFVGAPLLVLAPAMAVARRHRRSRAYGRMVDARTECPARSTLGNLDRSSSAYRSSPTDDINWWDVMERSSTSCAGLVGCPALLRTSTGRCVFAGGILLARHRRRASASAMTLAKRLRRSRACMAAVGG